MQHSLLPALLATALTLATLIAPTQAHAWGNEGHRVTGHIAGELLTPRARIRVNQLIPGGDLSEISLYMDINRKELSEKIPGSEKWHYDNEPVCKTLSYAQYCPHGDCASAKIPLAFESLKNGTPPLNDKALALRFLVHMIGDIHQPLHAADDSDLGGNLKFVLIPESDQGRRLHGVWDTDVVKRVLRGSNDAVFAKELLVKFKDKIPAWQSGTVRDWMTESHTLSKLVTYGNLPRFECGKDWPSTIVTPVALSEQYMTAAAETVPAQLAKAGARIAWMLNQALDGADVAKTESVPVVAAVAVPTSQATMLGNWKGTLEYRDYKTDKRVTLPTEIVATAHKPDGIELSYTFEDGPGKIVRWTSIVRLDLPAKRYFTQTITDGKPDDKRTEYQIISGAEAFQKEGKGTLQMIGKGIENGKDVDVWQTLTLDAGTYTLLRETRPAATPQGEFLFRHVYRMARTR